MNKLAQDLGLSVTDLYQAKTFNSKFKRSDIKGLTWSHWKALICLEPEAALKVAETGKSENLPVRDMQAKANEVKQKKQAKKPLKYAKTQLNKMLNPLSGIPDKKKLKQAGIKSISKETLKQLETKLTMAMDKLENVREFLGKLEVVEESEPKKTQKRKEKKKKTTKKKNKGKGKE